MTSDDYPYWTREEWHYACLLDEEEFVAKKYKKHEIVVKRDREGSESVSDWLIEEDNKVIGRASNLNNVTAFLCDKGYKVWAYRRNGTDDSGPVFVTTATEVIEDTDD
jgi:hypothetical protein